MILKTTAYTTPTATDEQTMQAIQKAVLHLEKTSGAKLLAFNAIIVRPDTPYSSVYDTALWLECRKKVLIGFMITATMCDGSGSVK